ncbi:hypothetical protein, partial [Salmonella enterica]|uniref:hypothetical protein n=1 Tax=Salmonella enterica TaxID=28901 RepID=UPI00165418FC
SELRRLALGLRQLALGIQLVVELGELSFGIELLELVGELPFDVELVVEHQLLEWIVVRIGQLAIDDIELVVVRDVRVHVRQHDDGLHVIGRSVGHDPERSTELRELRCAAVG